MDATTLRSLQAPLKQKYRDNPESARIVARAEVVLDPSQIAARLSSGAPRSAGWDPLESTCRHASLSIL